MKRFWIFLLIFLFSFGGVLIVKKFNQTLSWTELFTKRATPEASFRPEQYSLSNQALLDDKENRLLQRLNIEQINLVQKVVRSVVCIATQGQEERRITYRGQILEGQPPLTGIGSGVIISKEGHIITNDHVVAGKTVLRITMHNEEELEAVLVGSDPSLDIAVLKIKSDRTFDPLPFGDSDLVEVGQSVYAVGNPFGLGETVTTGIISAKERSFSDQQRDLFQTDAAINPGNSGGPLVNVFGEVIGINVAILATDADNPGSSGVGFSIPSNDVLSTFKQIAEKGRPIRGYLGVDLLEVRTLKTPPSKSASASKVMVYKVESGSPAAQVGLRQADELISYNGVRIESRSQVIRLIQNSPIGQPAHIQYLRDGRLEECFPVVSEYPIRQYYQMSQRNGRRQAEIVKRLESFGLKVRELSFIESIRGLTGVVITSVAPTSLAKRAGLMAGDLILTVNGQGLYTAQQFYSAIVRAKTNDRLTIVVQREQKRVQLLFSVN